MNILIPDSWLREYLETKASPKKIAQCLSLCGASVEKIVKEKDDWIYSVEVTSNRPDLASVIGIAREVAVILPRFGIKASHKGIILPTKINPPSKKLEITIQDPHHLCHRVLGVVLDQVSLGPSPETISQRLQAVGIRSLNNAIDITNYVMTEIGHPAHAFDYDRIKTQKLILRKAKPREKIISLEDKEYCLPGGDIVIDDGTGEIIDLPGIIGTANSVVTNKTKRVLFFIETNDPIQIRKTSMALNIRTVAATINEKGPDPELAKTALFRGIQLFKEITGAKIASDIVDIYPNPYKPKAIKISLQLIKQYLGVSIKSSQIRKILESLGFRTMRRATRDMLQVSVPSWRANDVSIPEDLIEEIARIYGYHNLPSTLPAGKLPQKPTEQTYNLETTAKNTLVNWGYTETYTYSMESEPQIKNCGLAPEKHLKIANSLSEEWLYMRRSLLPSLLSVIAENQTRREEIKIFELANVYLRKENQLPKEKLNLVICQTGRGQFYHLKGVMELLFKKLGVKNYTSQSRSYNLLDYKIKPLKESPIFNTNKTAEITVNGKLLGQLGEIKPQILSRFVIDKPVISLALDFEVIIEVSNLSKSFTPLAIYPPIIEDLTFIIKPKTYVQNLIQLIKECSLLHRLPGESRRPSEARVAQPRRKPQKEVSLIQSVELIDSYKNSRTLRITYQHPERNLTDIEVKKIREKIIKKVEEKLRVKLKA